jgi:hypothetical protein
MNIRETRACLSAIYQGLSGAADCWSDLKNDGIDTMLRVIDERETLADKVQELERQKAVLLTAARDMDAAYRNRFEVEGRGLTGPVDENAQALTNAIARAIS